MSDDEFGPIVKAPEPSGDDVFGPVVTRLEVDEETGEPVKRAVGRPNTFSDEIATRVIDAINDGMTLRQVEQLPGVPNKSTLFRWMGLQPQFNIAYHAALRWRTYARSDEIIDIADDASKDWKLEEVSEGGPPVIVLDKEHIVRTKLRIDARKWSMEKENPKRYGAAPTLLEDVRNPEQGQPGDNAKPVEGGAVRLIEAHPMTGQIAAWRESAKKA